LHARQRKGEASGLTRAQLWTTSNNYSMSGYSGETTEAYSKYFGITCYIFRFMSWIGGRYQHGVIFDFREKLRANAQALDILGDGKQRKSYLDVIDGVNGIFYAVQHTKERKDVFNLGHDGFMNVLDWLTSSSRNSA
jgi:UDP-glucose 4-epimerase